MPSVSLFRRGTSTQGATFYRTNMHIFCDMDGVLCDFYKHFKSYYGYCVTSIPSRNAQYKLVRSLPDTWWATMPWTPDGKLLWEYLAANYDKLKILSSPTDDTLNSCSRGKVSWTELNGIKNQVILEIKKEKHIVPGEASVLIDDTPKKIDDWRNAGGIGILHTSSAATIAALQRLPYEKD
jgi:FMN phosphatase YigB (HAD superfamily)